MRPLTAAAAACFLIGCNGDNGGIAPPTTGWVEILTTTSDPAAANYNITLDNGASRPAGANGRLVLSDVDEGTHLVQLGGVPTGCSVSGENPRTVSVTAGDTTTVEFTVQCEPPPTTGSLHIVTATTGADPDADGYTYALDAEAPQPIGTGSEVTLEGITPGQHTVLLGGLAPNCTLQGEAARTVTLTAGGTTQVLYNVTCIALLLQWSQMETGTRYNFADVWGSSPTDVFTVGEPGGRFTSSIFHFDGTTWSEQSRHAGARLTGIWGAAPNDVFSVGFSPLGDLGFEGLLLHYDGTTWSRMTPPPIEGTEQGFTEVDFLSVWGAAANDVYAVGAYFRGTDFALIAHYDGISWSKVDLDVEGDRALLDVHGTSAQSVYVVGYIDADDFLRRNAARASSRRIERAREQATRALTTIAIILQYDGAQWTELVPSGAEDLFLNSVWSSAANDVFAVGGAGGSGVIYHFDGSTWAPMTVPPVSTLSAVWGTSGSDVYAVGRGNILHYDGVAWTVVQRTGEFLAGVWASSAFDVFVVGGRGLIFRGTSEVAAAGR
jgi:hypothetical protein